jgi:hypothetical protein
MAYALRYVEELPPGVRKELDDLVAYYNHFLGQSLDEKGAILPAALVPAPGADISEESHWWRKGPWIFDEPNKQIAFLQTPTIASGSTLNDYAPGGIDDAIGLLLNIGGSITLTGIKAPLNGRRRLFILQNQSQTSTDKITLKHESALSDAVNRFSLPGATDIVLGPRETTWLLYDSNNAVWESFITKNVAGGLASTASPIYQATVSLTEANIIATSNTAVFSVAPTGGADTYLWPVAWSIEKKITQSGGSTGTRAISALGTTQLIYAHTDFLGFSLANDLTNDLSVGSRQFINGTSAASRNFSNFSTRDPRNKGLGISFGSAAGTFSGTGVSSLRVSVAYYILASQGVTPP